MQYIVQWLKYSFDLAQEASPYLLLGLCVAALMKALIPQKLVDRALGGHPLKGVFMGAFIGTPIPLCSCGVLPVVQTLRKQGAKQPASLSFLVATPENGADSFFMTWGMLGLPFAVTRVVAGFISAVTVGLVDWGFSRENRAPANPKEETPSCCAAKETPARPSLKESFRYAFVDLMDDIGGSLILGLLLGGAITLMLPADFASQHLGGNLSGMLAVLMATVPLYLCAAASTPLAVSLMVQGMSPGTALVMLLAGPATNTTSFTVISRLFGLKATLRYIGVLVLCALSLGVACDALFNSTGLSLKLNEATAHNHETTSFLHLGSTIIVLLLCARPYLQKALTPRPKPCCGSNSSNG